MKQTICTRCLIRSTCTAPCAAVEARLPGENRGEIRGLGRQEFARRFEARRAYVRFLLDWRHVLRGRLSEVFSMRYDRGLEISAIAAKLGVTNGTASEYLKRARRTIMKASRRARGTVVVPGNSAE